MDSRIGTRKELGFGGGHPFPNPTHSSLPLLAPFTLPRFHSAPFTPTAPTGLLISAPSSMLTRMLSEHLLQLVRDSERNQSVLAAFNQTLQVNLILLRKLSFPMPLLMLASSMRTFTPQATAVS